MGKLLSKIFGNKEMRILMLGLDAAGKTSILFNVAYFPFLMTSEPPVSDHPKCQLRCSLTGGGYL